MTMVEIRARGWCRRCGELRRLDEPVPDAPICTRCGGFLTEVDRGTPRPTVTRSDDLRWPAFAYESDR